MTSEGSGVPKVGAPDCIDMDDANTPNTTGAPLRTSCVVAAPTESGKPVAEPGNPPTTVLYIDDNEVNLLLMEQLLASVSGWRLLTTANPVQGLQLAEKEAPRLVLLDIHMPVMDGFAVLARLRSHPATADLPVVAVSADSAPADQRTALAAGFTDYLTKPLDLERVLQTLRRLAGREPAPSPQAP